MFSAYMMPLSLELHSNAGVVFGRLILRPLGKLFASVPQQDVEDEELSAEEMKERRIMKMLLKVKNGTPPQRKSALRQLTDKARDLGAGPLFNQILPLLMSPTLEDQERHLLVKVHLRSYVLVPPPLLAPVIHYRATSKRSPPIPCSSQ